MALIICPPFFFLFLHPRTVKTIPSFFTLLHILFIHLTRSVKINKYIKEANQKSPFCAGERVHLASLWRTAVEKEGKNNNNN